MKLILFLGIQMVLYNTYSAEVRLDPLVKIEQGLIRGQKSSDGDYSTFLGVPYAQVDLSNPFGASKPHPGFGDEIFNAYDGLIECPQRDFYPLPNRAAANIHETLDCLTLNIYVPNEASTRNPLPVLVWVHGGGFGSGSAGHEGIPYVIKKGIIVVSMNYRLGPYGFFCLDSPLAPGNQGLKDQYESLTWVRKNIAAFGGNPYNVTLGGLSAGGISALHYLYSNKEKLYNKVISHSGVPQASGTFVDGDVDAAVKIANHLGLNTNNTEEALGLLINTPSELVMAAFLDLRIRLRPCKEKTYNNVDQFIDNYPNEFTNERKIRNTPILIGHTSKETLGELDQIYSEADFADIFNYKIKRNFKFSEDLLRNVSKDVRHFYIGDEAVSKDILTKLEAFDADFSFNHPVQRTITGLLEENAGPVYEYLFSFVRDQNKPGAGHASDQKYLFVMEEYNYNLDFTEEDYIIRDIMTELWSNFIKYGNPTPQSSEQSTISWKPVTTESRPYLVLDRDTRLEHRVYNHRMAFWDLFYTVYHNYRHIS